MKSLSEAAKIVKQNLADEPISEIRSWMRDILESAACQQLIDALPNGHTRDVIALLAGIRIGIEMEKP